MMTAAIPTINMDPSVLTRDTLGDYVELLYSRIRESLTVFGNELGGVVDSSDPSTNQNDLVKPLWFYSNTDDRLGYVLLAGTCVSPAGDIMQVPRTEFRIPSTTELCVICVQHDVVDSQERLLTQSNQLVAVETKPVVTVKCITLGKYMALGAAVRMRICVVGGILYDATASATVNTHMTAPTTEYPWMRPWFSFRDVQHRSYVGSGTTSPTNPHGLGFDDLDAGEGMSIYDQLTSSGMILSKDTSISGVPGYVCFDSFTESDIKTDVTGKVTLGSYFGGVGSYYVELTQYPNTITSVQNTGKEIACDWIQGSRILVLLVTTKPTDLIIGYTITKSLALFSSNAGTLAFSNVDSNDLVISGGKRIQQISNPLLQIKRFSMIPRGFRVYVNNNVLLCDPTVTVPAFTVSGKQNRNLVTNTLIPSPMFVGVGIHNPGNGFNVRVDVVGLDAYGASASESLFFNSYTYEDSPLPPELQENEKQVLYTSTSFSEITSVTIIDNDTDALVVGAQCVGIIYLKLDPSKHRFCEIHSGYWNGREIQSLKDTRRVNTVIRDGVFGVTPISGAAEILVGTNELLGGNTNSRKISLVCSEDFKEPRVLNATTVLWEGREILDVPVLPKTLVDSTGYRNVYRSRMIGIRKYTTELASFFVILHGVESVELKQGLVRVLLGRFDSTDIEEAILVPLIGDTSMRMFIGYTNKQFDTVGFVVSGTCKGFSAYYINGDAYEDARYVVTTTKH
jgi:hypothetical protein